VQVRYGRGAMPKGFLPVYSVESEEMAERLLVATCSRGMDGNYYSDELAREHSLDALSVFTDKLDRVYRLIKAKDAEKERERRQTKKVRAHHGRSSQDPKRR
jgi:hypothetical protein